jgi:hypothetical protein
MRTYILPLLDVVNRIRFNSELAALPKSCILTAGTSLTVQLEQALLEGITVQVGSLRARAMLVCLFLGWDHEAGGSRRGVGKPIQTSNRR